MSQNIEATEKKKQKQKGIYFTNLTNSLLQLNLHTLGLSEKNLWWLEKAKTSF